MRKFIEKCILPCVILGGILAEITFCFLLRQCFSLAITSILTVLPLIPFLIYGAARKLPAGKTRKACNLIGGTLLSADCYFMIYTTIIGAALILGLPKNHAGLLLFCDLSLTALSVLAGTLYANRIKKTYYTVSLPDVKSCKIVFFSDLHLGDFCTVGHLKKVVSLIRSEKPDLVLFGGDLVDMDMPSPQKADRYAKILSLVGCIIGCEGNHDLHDLQNEDREAFLKKANIRILCDESITDPKTGLCITGRKSKKRDRLPAMSLDPDKKHILLEHDPKTANEALLAGFSLVLCGHTHKGQTFPGNILRRLGTRYFYGKYDTKNGTVITTSGCGSTGLPLRLFVTSEITTIQITPSPIE